MYLQKKKTLIIFRLIKRKKNTRNNDITDQLAEFFFFKKSALKFYKEKSAKILINQTHIFYNIWKREKECFPLIGIIIIM